MKKNIFSVFIFVTIAFFMWLGLWQVERLRWKEGLIWQLEKYKEARPEELILKNYDKKNHLYKPVYSFGAFMHDNEFLLSAKYFDETRDKKTLGYHVITPFLTARGTIIFVNRGWIPEKLKDREARPNSLTPHNMEDPLKGILRKPDGKAPWFMPQNTPEKNVWFWIDLEEMITKLEETSDFDRIEPVLIQQVISSSMDDFKYPIPVSRDIKIYNQHLVYAVTWFSMAFITLIMWFFWLKKQEKKS